VTVRNSSRTLGVALAICCAGVVAVNGAASTSAARQRIAIEERVGIATSKGTFRLIPLTRGAVKADSGTAKLAMKRRGPYVVNGQSVTTYDMLEELVGRRGTFAIRSSMRSTQAGGDYLIASGSWSVSPPGAKSYVGFRARGAASAVLDLLNVIRTRYEGYVIAP
jgi:hypothetical protein